MIIGITLMMNTENILGNRMFSLTIEFLNTSINLINKSYFRVSISEEDLVIRFYKLCDALDHQESLVLSELVEKMRSSIAAESSAYSEQTHGLKLLL